MKSMAKNKGLISLLSLLVCISLFVTSTYAWFSDTATVKGNKIYAGNLSVDVVAKVGEIAKLQGWGEDYSAYKTSWTNFVTDNTLKTVDGKNGDDVSVDADTYIVLTGKEVPIFEAVDIEPGKTEVVKVSVRNSGDLAVSYSAGFSIDKNNSKTGLQMLKDQEAKPGDFGLDANKVAYRATKLVPMQAGIKDAATGTKYTWAEIKAAGKFGDGMYDLGQYLESILEVYAMTEDQYNLAKTADNHKAAMELKKDGDAANYIGTVADIMHCNDSAYLKSLDEKIVAANVKVNSAQTAVDAITTDTPEADAEAKYAALSAAEIEQAALTAEKTELANVSARLAKNSSGYCVTEELDGSPVTIYGKDGVELDAEDYPAGYAKGTNASSIGTAFYAIHMPETAGNLFQNAGIKLNVGVTATQVECETDGIGVQIYDDAHARSAG